MRTKLFSMNWLALGFALLLVFQSCTVYKKVPVTADEAVASNNKVKIIRPGGQEYKFKRIIREEGDLVGLVRKHSQTATDLATLKIPDAEESKFYSIDLDQLPDKQFYAKNKEASFFGTVGLFFVIPVSIILGVWADYGWFFLF